MLQPIRPYDISRSIKFINITSGFLTNSVMLSGCLSNSAIQYQDFLSNLVTCYQVFNPIQLYDDIRMFAQHSRDLNVCLYWWRLNCVALTHWGRVMHICVGNLTIIGSDNGLSPGRRQAITWTNVGILLIGPIGINFSEMLMEIHTFWFKKIHLKMSGKWRPFCLGLNVFE